MPNICSECGAQNEAGAGFCVFCHTFLAWDEETENPTSGGASRQAVQPRTPTLQEATSAETPGRAVVPAAAPLSEAGVPPAAAADEIPADTTAGRFRVEVDHVSVGLAATGEPALIHVGIANTSSIVDGYVVEAPGAPEWLKVEADQIQLLPGTEKTLALRLRIVSETLVPVQESLLALRITSLSQASAHFDFAVPIVVQALDVPVEMRAEPSMLRVRDRDTAECHLVVDNSASNRPVRLSFTGSDPELAVGFVFDPAELDVAPGAAGSVRVVATAHEPEPGQVMTRSLTLTAHDGDRGVEAHVTLQQATSLAVEDPPVGLEVRPSLVRAVDGEPATARVVADNRAGTRWAHLHFMATDPEGVVKVIWIPSRLDVPPGRTAHVEALLEAAPPPAGAEVSRTVTVKASDGARISTAVATLVQVTSPSPMTTLELRVEPSFVRVHDASSTSVRVVVDNQRGHSAAKVFLKGTDPEQAMRFAFSSPTVELAAGQARAVELRLDSRPPPPGQETTRQFTVVAGDGHDDVEASGTLVQTSSRDAIELLAIRLDPSVLRLAPWRRGVMAARVDNRGGARPVRVALTGDDPENVIGFTFVPSVLEIPAGRVANSHVKLKINRAPSALEMTRPFTIIASDGRADVQADGELIQTALSLRPLARVLFTVFGGLAMILGAFLPLLGGAGSTGINDRRGLGLNADTLAQAFNRRLDLSGLTNIPPSIVELVSAGLVAIVLGTVTIFGLTGRSGRLTRLASLLGAFLLIALFVAFAVLQRDVSPALGAYVTLIGCVLGYVGGLLVRSEPQ